MSTSTRLAFEKVKLTVFSDLNVNFSLNIFKTNVYIVHSWVFLNSDREYDI